MVLKKIGILQKEFTISTTGGNSAFSLVEMLMALLVASLLMAALAPVLTKKINSNIMITGVGSSNRAPAMYQCWDYNSPELEYIEDGSNYKVLKDFKIDDAWVVNFIIASGGGGGAGATQPVIAEDSYAEPADNRTDGIKITYDMDDFEIDLMTGGGGGGGGGAAIHEGATCTGSPSVSKCECMGAVYDSANKICVINAKVKGPLSLAVEKCGGILPSSMWTLPSMDHMANWSASFRGTLGIGSTSSVWSKDGTIKKYNCSHKIYKCAPGDGSKKGASPEYNTTYRCISGPDGQAAECSPPPPESCVYFSVGSYYEGYDSLTQCLNYVWDSVKVCSGGCYSELKKTDSESATNVSYYRASGTSWNAVENSTDKTASRNFYCVYSSTSPASGETFYSISGGGGGAAPSIKLNEFDVNIKEKLRQRIKENVGGYIVLDAGLGGSGGSASTAKGQKAGNGSKGGDSCILIKDGDKNVKYQVCVPGGNGGTGANASISDYLANGFGKGGEKVSTENNCYAIDYTTDSSGVRTDFNCSAEGKAGGDGGVGTNSPTAGGKGGASILTPTVQAANSGKNGVTPDDTVNPGAGGGGGSATKTGSNTSVSLGYGSGGTGARGIIRLKYNHKYEAAGGGGGGGGYVAHIKNVSVGKSATCSLKVGYGGQGGAPGVKGGDGGDSSIVCSNAPTITYKIFGGKGGEPGVSASGASGVSVGGLGGKAGYFEESSIFSRLLAQGNLVENKGVDGKQGGSGETSNYKQGIRSAGGGGGASGSGESGKCGGLYNEDGGCSSVSVDENNNIPEPSQNALNGEGFGGSEITAPKKDDVVDANPKYGKAGAGGGGGAWHAGKESGRGGAGLGGYACIYWEKLE